MEALQLLSLIVFLPALGALLLAFVPGRQTEAIRYLTLGVTAAVVVLCLFGFFSQDTTAFNTAAGEMQDAFNLPWIPSFGIHYFMGVDGISFPLVMLTAVISMLAMGASWSITKHVKGYCILFLLLETGMLGVFLALDFFLFYVFWEVMLLPMYFLIGVWGGPRREYAAIKFFLYTLVGSVLMLIAILMLYFHSDLHKVAAVSNFRGDRADAVVDWDRLNVSHGEEVRLGRIETDDLVLLRTDQEANRALQIALTASDSAGATSVEYDSESNQVTVTMASAGASPADVVAVLSDNADVAAIVTASLASPSDSGEAEEVGQVNPALLEMPAVDPSQPIHTFNLLALAAVGQHTDCFDNEMLFGWSVQIWSFILLFIGFAIKVPSVPLHTWLPDAHVEAPTPISMILAGVLLKMGGYGIIRICYPICPEGGYSLAFWVCLVGIISMVYGAFAALAQKDFKRLVAYSSVSHMGYVVLGLGVWSTRADYWNMGVQGAMFQMIAHGVSSSGMFFMVGVIYDRVHHRNLDQFGGLFGKMPVYTALAIGIFFAGLGLPGLCGFPGEVFVVLSVWNYSKVLAVVAAGVVVLTAGYILWSIQRVYLGPEYKGPHPEALTPSTPRERLIATVLFIGAILFGVLPHHTLLRFMETTVEQQVDDLAALTPQLEAKAGRASHEQDGVAALPAFPPRSDFVVNQRVTPAAETLPSDSPSSTQDPSREPARTR